MKGNEQEDFFVMSYNELVLGDVWRETENPYEWVKREATRTSLTFENCNLPSQNDEVGHRGRTHFMSMEKQLIIYFIKNHISIGTYIVKIG